MRSEPVDDRGHQATYRANGTAIYSGVAAGSADRGLPGTREHRDRDVLPFIWAAQLDGNPVEPSPLVSTPATLTRPLFFSGVNLSRYFIARPAVANNKSEPEKDGCGQ